jgi:DNA-binding NtrC family response regulator
VEPTILAKSRVEVRGGTLSVVGDAHRSLEIGPEPRVVGRSPGCDLKLDDKRVSSAHLEVVATERGVRVRDLGSRNGTFLGDTRIVEVFLSRAATISCGDMELRFAPSKPETVAVSKGDEFGPLVGGAPQMRVLFEQLRRIAKTNLSVLVLGETGTGKELVAQAIHRASERTKKPFVVVDCGAIPTGLAESVLFGHERGAFTGAITKGISPFVEAEGGTVFLDELGELPIDMQPRLLRVLAEQRVKSVGSNAYVSVNVRVVAATRRDILREVNAGSFRSDLYFRVAQAKVQLPPLRDRRSDIPALVYRMMNEHGSPSAYRRVSPESLERLERYDWPGNVRELRNVVQLALAYDQGGTIDIASHLSTAETAGTPAPAPRYADRPFAQVRRETERAYFTALHEAAEGNVSEIARRAELDRATVRVYLRRHKIGKTGRGAR